jgi:hypothetical protein
MGETAKTPKVKGALLVGMAMVINNSRNLGWSTETELTTQDLDQISKGVFASQWYERDLYQKMGAAVYKLVGKNQPENAFMFGKGVMYDTLIKVYRGPLLSEDPREILAKFALFYGTTWFNFGRAEFRPNSKGGVFHIYDPEGVPFGDGFAAMISGVFHRLVQDSKGENVKIETEKKSTPGTGKINELILNITWD